MRSASVILASFSVLLGCASTSEIETLNNDIGVTSIPVRSSSEAAAIVETKISSLMSMVNPESDPYFGKKEPGPTCTNSLRPSRSDVLEKDGSFSTTIHLFATESKIYGSCDPKLDTQKNQITWLFCEARKTLFETKYFYSAKADWHKALIARCR